MPSQLSWKKSLLLTCKILVLLVNTLAVDDKYPVLNKENLLIPIQMELFQKQETFPQELAPILQSGLNLKYFLKKDKPHRLFNSEIRDSENVVR